MKVSKDDKVVPGLLGRVLVRLEAFGYIVGGFLVANFVVVPPTERRGVIGAVLEIISSRPGLITLAFILMALGVFAMWSVSSPERVNILTQVVFGFFLVRLYLFLASVADIRDAGDTRWLTQLIWVIIWSFYFLMLQRRVDID